LSYLLSALPVARHDPEIDSAVVAIQLIRMINSSGLLSAISISREIFDKISVENKFHASNSITSDQIKEIYHLSEKISDELKDFQDWLDLTSINRGQVPHRQYIDRPEMVEEMRPFAEKIQRRQKVKGASLLIFFADRLKVLLREQGKRHDLVDAVFALGDDDLVRIVDRVEALDAFLKTEDGANLLAGYKRATNILKAEERKDGAEVTGEPEARADAPGEEIALLDALQRAIPEVDAHLSNEQFALSMKSLAGLRAPVDAFFEKVLVNDQDAAVRQNRLRLLAQVRAAMGRVADFSLIAG
jgi:hypothetical protein